MKAIATATVADYIEALPEERKIAIGRIRTALIQNLPPGFEEVISYGMIGYVVPHSLYAPGHHCDRSLPLPFINLASQKNFIALYHMGIYSNPKLLEWFLEEYPKHTGAKLDMGKSCIRFKKMDLIPYELIGELAKKMSVTDWINAYESAFQK